jgi:tRNA(fMet)-specific endonuclease VapC
MDEPMERERLLVDTSVLIDHLRKSQKEKTIFYQLNFRYDYVISSITEFEFLIGASPRSIQFTADLLAMLPVLPFDTSCVKTASAIYHNLKAKNQIISLPDIFIAATAITFDLQLLTLNQKHFDRIKQIKLVPLI